MPRLKVIQLDDPTDISPWGQAVLRIVGARHDVSVFDYEQAPGPQVEAADVIIDVGGEHLEPQVLAEARQLKLWQIIAVGVDGVDLSPATRRGIPVANTPGFTSAAGLSDAAIMFMIMLVKRYHEGAEFIRHNDLHTMANEELEGQTLGLIGFGASGQALAHKAIVFGMRIMIIEPMPIVPEVLDQIKPVFVGTPDQMDKVIAASDFVSLHLPLMDETEKIIDARRISLMKPTACLINVARGRLVDEPALHQALLEERIGGIGTDVFAYNQTAGSSKLLDHPRFVALPHVSGTTTGAFRRRAQVALENVDRIGEGLEPKHRIA